MLTGRGFGMLVGGLGLWAAARVLGSPDLHIVAVGFVVLALLSLLTVRFLRHHVEVGRRLSAPRVFPQTRVRVELEVRNRARTRTSVLLLEDRLPPTLGRGARAVLAGVPARSKQTVAYSVTCRWRGRYRIGPLTMLVSDPFGLARTTTVVPGHEELIVFPEVEQIDHLRPAAAGGESGTSRSRHLLRSGEDFYTMRQYEVGDDLRRIHWPSVARTGELMIRQHEAARRASATVFLDTRAVALPRGDPFERAVSSAASLAVAYSRAGFSLRLSSPDLPPTPMSGEDVLETLALVDQSSMGILAPALMRLRDLSATDAALAVVMHVPDPMEIAALIRVASGYGPKTAVLVDPRHPGSAIPGPGVAQPDPATAARASLVRAGWEVVLLSPSGRLREAWPLRSRRPARTATAF